MSFTVISVLIDSLYCTLYCTLSVLFNGYIQRLTAYELNGLSIYPESSNQMAISLFGVT